MNVTKVKKQARIFIVCTIAAIIGLLAYLTATAFSVEWSKLTAASFLLSMPATVLAVLTVFHALMLLRSVVKSESPFTLRNIRHLQWIGWLFVLFEPADYLCQAISNRFFPISLGNGLWMASSQTYGGVFLVCGFVILTVSTIFRYGMELQQLSDETL